MLFGIGFLNLYPISRAAGAMYQSARGNAEVRVSFLKKKNVFQSQQNQNIFKGACLRYDALEEILIATPFKGGADCWNAADWLVIISPICLLAIPILDFIVRFCYDRFCDDRLNTG